MSVCCSGDPNLPEGILFVSPTSLEFGEVVVWQRSPSQLATITNTGPNPVSIGSIRVVGDFVLKPLYKTRLEPGESVEVEVSFSPQGTGIAHGRVYIGSANGSQSFEVQLTGTGISKVVEIIPLLLNYWTEHRYQVGDQRTASVWRPISDDDHANAVVEPKGQGSFQTSFGGNLRGQQAVDLQMLRSSPDQIASGLRSVILGGRWNTAAGQYSIAGGEYNNVPGNFSVTVGGREGLSQGDRVFIGTGEDARARGDNSAAIAGLRNYAEGQNSLVGAGARNWVAGEGSVILAGRDNFATGNSTAVLAGDNNRAEGNGSFIGSGNELTLDTDQSFIGTGFSIAMTDSESSAIIAGSDHLIDRSATSFIGSGKNLKIVRSPASLIGTGRDVLIELSPNSVVVTGTNQSLIRVPGGFLGAGNQNGITFTLDPDGFTRHPSDYSGVVSGDQNLITGSLSSFMGSGRENLISRANYSMILTGYNNQIRPRVVGLATTVSANSAILSGTENVIETTTDGLIGVGSKNTVTDGTSVAVVTGSENTIAQSEDVGVISGSGNEITGSENVGIVSADETIVLRCRYASVVSGQANQLRDSNWTGIMGGRGHLIEMSDLSGIGFGEVNQIKQSLLGVILSGQYNTVDKSTGGAVLSGNQNYVGGAFGAVIAGDGVHIGGQYSVGSSGFNINDSGVGNSHIRGDVNSYENKIAFPYYGGRGDGNLIYLLSEQPLGNGKTEFISRHPTLFIPEGTVVHWEITIHFSVSVSQNSYHQFKIRGVHRRDNGMPVIEVLAPVVEHPIEIAGGLPNVVPILEAGTGRIWFQLFSTTSNSTVRWYGELNAHYLKPVGTVANKTVIPNVWFYGGQVYNQTLQSNYPQGGGSSVMAGFQVAMNAVNRNGIYIENSVNSGRYTSVTDAYFPIVNRITAPGDLVWRLDSATHLVEGQRILGIIPYGGNGWNSVQGVMLVIDGNLNLAANRLSMTMSPDDEPGYNMATSPVSFTFTNRIRLTTFPGVSNGATLYTFQGLSAGDAAELLTMTVPSGRVDIEIQVD